MAVREVFLRPSFKEMNELESLIQQFEGFAQVEVIDRVRFNDLEFPLYSIVLGTPAPDHPAIGFFGGVHGLERIGSDVVLSYMRTILELIKWDKVFQKRLETSSLIFMPIVNPVGIALMRRSNGNGVDLMRNSPLNSIEPTLPLVSGQTYSKKLPWFRGDFKVEMEKEAQALCQVVKRHLWPAKLSMAIDIHSGFGIKDRLWFPYAYSRKPFPYIAEAYAFMELLNQTYPHHVYEIEPVSRQYTIQGDLWDHLFLENESREERNFFLPWTLEMGSWNWLKKNPFQIFSPLGIFHPIKPHRRSRTVRRHLPLFDFIHRSCLSPEAWLNLSVNDKQQLKLQAQELWYESST